MTPIRWVIIGLLLLAVVVALSEPSYSWKEIALRACLVGYGYTLAEWTRERP